MSKILATVGSTMITDTDLNEFLEGLGPRAQSYNNPEGRKLILEQLIGNRLLLLEARKNLFEIEPQFKAQLAKIKDSLLSSYALEKALSSVTITDAEAEEYYNSNKDKFDAGESVIASHILVDSEELAAELIEKINKGEISFEEAARKHSSCPSKQNGGSLGEFKRGQMVPEFDSAVFSMEEGKISETPVKTQFGYHVIKLDKKNESAPVPFAEIKDEIKAGLLSEKKRAAYESKLNQLKILFPVDKTI